MRDIRTRPRSRFGDRPANHQASRVTIVSAALVALALTGVLIYLAAVAPRGVPTVDYVNVTAQFERTADIKLLSTVALNGKRIGQVDKIDSNGRVALVRLQLEPGTALRSDTTARIRVKNPVGAKYVDLTPGTMGRTLQDGDVLPVAQTSTSVDTPELLETFPPDTRADVQDTVQGLGKGFAGRGQELNGTLTKAAPVLDDLKSASDAVVGRGDAAARFAPSAASLAEAYDPVRGDLGAGFRPQADALAAFGDSRSDLQQLFGVAPGSLSSLRTAFDRATPLLRTTAGLARASQRLTGPAPAALRETTKLLVAGRPALRETRPLLDALSDAVDPTLRGLQTFRPQIAPTIAALQDQLPPLRQLALQSCDVLAQGANWRSALSWGVPGGSDPASDLDETDVGPNLQSFRVLGVPPATTEALLADSATKASIAGGVAEDPYPSPCTAPGNVKK